MALASSNEVNTLLDDVVEALTTGRGFFMQDPRATIAAHRLLNRLRAARPFVLDDSFTETATTCSLGEPRELLDLWQSARPPYPSVWIEFDERVRTRVQVALRQTIGPETLIEKSGYLIEQDPHDPARFRCYVFFRVLPDTTRKEIHWRRFNGTHAPLGLSVLGLCIDTEKHAALPAMPADAKFFPDTHAVNISHLHSGDFMETLHNTSGDAPENVRNAAHAKLAEIYNEQFLEAVVFGRGYLVGQKDISTCRELVARISTVLSPCYTLVDWSVVPNLTRAQRLTMSTVTVEGDPRMVVSVLGLLQRYTYETTRLAKPRYEKFTRGKKVRYMEQHVLTIVAPKERVITIGDEGAHSPHGMRRAHEVLGHFCHSLKGRNDPVVQACQHHWINDVEGHPNQQHCVKCGWFRWWRKACTRGDASKGFVNKHYRVVAPE